MNSEIIQEDITGLIFKSMDVNALADKMKYLITNKSLILNMSNNCVKIAPDFDYEKVLSNIFLD